MSSSKIKSLLEAQRIKREFGNENVGRALSRYQRNLNLLKGITYAAEKSLFLILLISTILATLSLSLNYINSQIFNKQIILQTVNQFNLLLPFIVAILPGISIFQTLYQEDENYISPEIMGKIIGISTIMALTPLFSIISNYAIKNYLL